jgi:hypothetical protein
MIKTVCSLFVQFSFLPQVIWAAILYQRLVAHSYVLINTRLHMTFFAVFTGIVVLAVLTSVRRFYASRFLLVGAYIMLTAATLYFNFRGISAYQNQVAAFVVFGAFMTALNMTALYIYRHAGANAVRPQKGEDDE